MDRRKFINLSCRTLASLMMLPGLSGISLHENFLSDETLTTGKKARAAGEIQLTEEEIKAREAMYYSRLENEQIRCELCFRGCRLSPGDRGYCRVRKNHEGKLYTLVYGNMTSVTYGPVEKKPLHQYKPGAQANNYGTAGCNLRCKFCHNWRLSQKKLEEVGRYEELTPERAVLNARSRQASLISFTYNEPTVFYEFMLDTARKAREEGLGVNVNTNAVLQEEPLRELMQHADSATVDLKGFSEEFYRDICEGELEPVLNNLKIMKEMGVWVEVVNLVIPTLNDDEDMIEDMCGWLYEELGPETPLHLNRFMPRYKLQDLSSTPVETLERARNIAIDRGLKYVYIGNVPGHDYNATFCPNCGEEVIKRHHFSIESVNIKEGECEFCDQSIAGIWED